jgi:hypothetical protein
MNLSHEKRELAKEAKELRESPAFKAALERAKQRRIDDLLSESTAAQTTEAKLAIIAELRAFQAVEQELKSIADDLIMGRRYA